MKIRSLAKAVSVSAVLCLALIPVPARAQQSSPPHWSYSGDTNPKDWGKLDPSYALCSTGKHQSPIDIQTKDAKPADLPALQFSYKDVPLSVVDNGHTVMVNYAPGSTLTVGDHIYTLKQFHFHHPSEEHINGKSHALVAHLVHSDADGRLAVVAILFDQGADNAEIDSIWLNIPKEKEKTADLASVTINAKDLLPADHGYFTFSGSLTTPPCSEGVTWYVLRNPSHMSEAEIKAFAKLYPHDNRPIQPLNDREVLRTK
jgi:carbonic anhydrase